MSKKIFIIISIVLTTNLHASNNFVGFGGFSYFPFSTQDDVSGGTSMLAFDPLITFGTVMDFAWGHKFLPEAGYSFRLSTDDEYSKSTLFLLLDLGLPMNGNLLLRYGIGYFRFTVSGDGQALIINNGTSTSTAYAPSGSSTSSHITLNLGIEGEIQSNNTLRFEVYTFEMMTSEKLDLSYNLTINYYL